MSQDLRERVARALFDHAIGGPEGLAWDRVHESVREGYLRAADVAIEVIDPNPVKVMWGDPHNPGGMRDDL